MLDRRIIGTYDQNMAFEEKIHQEILQTLERRSNFDIRKIAILTALIGGGVIKLDGITLFGTLYLVPLVAISCDLFIMREVWSLRRMGQFLKFYGNGDDQKYERYISNKRNPFYPVGCALLSFVTIAASIWLLAYWKSIPLTNCAWNIHDSIWVGISIVFWLIVHIGGYFYIRIAFPK